MYPAEFTLSCHFPTSRRDGEFRDSVAVVNQIESSFGAGWSVRGLERIHRAATGDLLLTDGRIEPLVFSPAVRAVAEISQSGERDLYRVVANSPASH